MKTLFKSVVLLVVFIVTFLVTTIIFDTIDRHDGYYNQGIQDSNEVGH
jgi:uncharacterized protein (DUF2164 family)